MKMKKVKSLLAGSLKENVLTIATLAGVIIGVILGVVLKSSRDEPWSKREAMYVSYIGDLFLNMLKGVIIPLIIPSVIASIGSMDLSLSGKVGLRAVAYYMTTTVLAVILGIILVVIIKPGAGGIKEKDLPHEDTKRNVTTADTLMDLVRNCFPPNIIQAALQQYKTELVYPGETEKTDAETGATVNPDDKTTWRFKPAWSDGTNILGLIVFSIVTGVAIAICGEDGKPLLSFFESVSIVMMKVTTWIIYLSPVGVCFLVAGQLLEMKNNSKEFAKLGWYFFTVLLGLFIHGFIVLPIIFSLATRSLPFRFIANMGNPLVTAFGTASSSATLPVTISAMEKKNKVDPKIARFVLPIGVTINMDGTALYEAVAALFIAQMDGMNLSYGQILAMSITATAASIGAAGIPQAGLVTMITQLALLVDLPGEALSLILSVDWLLDRFRTVINVLGDSIGAGIVSHLSKREMEDLEMKEETNLDQGH